MAEFALIAPVAFLLLMSIIVVAIVVTNFIQVTNVARQGARVAAICASEPQATAQIPNGSSQTCSLTNLQTYMEQQLTAVPANSVSPTIQVCNSISSGCSTLPNIYQGVCNTGQLIQVQMTYPQPLYLPLVSNVFETSPNGTRKLEAQAEAACE